MKIFGKPLSEYIAFGKLFLVLVPMTGIIRLALSLNGNNARWVSMTVIGLIGVVYFAVRIQTTGFGGYKELLVLCTLQNLASQVISITGIILAIVSGVNNIYSIPEFAFGSDGKTWSHVMAHVFVGSTVGSVVPWLFGCLVLFLARKLIGGRQQELKQSVREL